MKITESQLRRIIHEEMDQHFTWSGDTDPRLTPKEKQFFNGPDELAGYITVKEVHDNTTVASAPITRTDGPDRPFLVRTTDTKWHVPFWVVRLIYPGVMAALNAVDSVEDWRTLAPGSSGRAGEFQWFWSESEPVPARVAEGTVRLTRRQLHRLVRESMQVSAGLSYMREYEDPMSAVQKMLSDYLKDIPRDEVKSMAPGSPEIVQEIEHALDQLGILHPVKRDLIARPLRMVPPIALLAPSASR